MPTHVLEEVNGENIRNLGGFWVLTGLSLFKTSAYSYLGFLPCVTVIIIILSFFSSLTRIRMTSYSSQLLFSLNFEIILPPKSVLQSCICISDL